MLLKLRSKMQKANNQKGFTLVELMVVVVIIGILAAIAVPVYNNVASNAKDKADLANIRTIEGALQAYLASNPGDYSALTLAADADGTIAGTGVTGGKLVPDYLKEMPKSPHDNSTYYSKAAAANVVNSYTP